MDFLSWTSDSSWSSRLRRMSLWTSRKRAATRKTRPCGLRPLAATLRSLTREVTCEDAMRRRSIATVTQQPATNLSHSTLPLITPLIREEGLREESGSKTRDSLDEDLMQASLQCILIQEETPLWTSSVCSTKLGLVSLEDIHDTAGGGAFSPQGRHVEEIEAFPAIMHDEALMVDDEYSDTATLVEGGVSSYNCDFQRDREIICEYLRDSRNVVDESPEPQRMPHIVVTRPEECWEDMYTPWQNRLYLQWVEGGNLTVPPLNISTGRLSAPGDHTSPFDGLDRQQPPLISPPTNYPLSEPPHVVSLSKLPWQGMSISEEIYKQLFAFAATEACELAQSFRLQYDDSTTMFASFERPFTWKDPAEPILASYGIGSFIIESSCPFQIPHIVIHTPLPFFTAPEENRTPPIQDAAFGQLLTVRSSLVQIVNEPESWSEEHSQYSDSDIDMDELSGDTFSRPESPTPQTPLDQELESFDYVVETAPREDLSLEELIDLDSESYEEASTGVDTSVSGKTNIVAQASSTCRLDPEFRIEEDEDDLPSLDDW